MRKPPSPGDDLDAELQRVAEERRGLLEARAARVRLATIDEARAIEALRQDARQLQRRFQPARNAALALDRDVRERGSLLPLAVGGFAVGFAGGAGLLPGLVAVVGAAVAWLFARIIGSASLG